VFEIQLLMQIIINRIALIAEHRSTVTKLKWGTVALITTINVAVFTILIPAHTSPPTSKTFVKINNVWDKISKLLILIVDAGLNWYFLRTVKQRLVKQHGLTKYQPLFSFNIKLMVLSIAMDVGRLIFLLFADPVLMDHIQVTLIGLMFLKNQVVYIQFHPVVYIVKLNIEMSMASLVVRLAQGKPGNDMYPEESFQGSSNKGTQLRSDLRSEYHGQQHLHIRSVHTPKRAGKNVLEDDYSAESLRGIHCQTDYDVTVEQVESNQRPSGSSISHETPRSALEDGPPLPKSSKQMHFYDV
jgi:hypothetical protein